jgi:hypothetical protein
LLEALSLSRTRRFCLMVEAECANLVRRHVLSHGVVCRSCLEKFSILLFLLANFSIPLQKESDLCHYTMYLVPDVGWSFLLSLNHYGSSSRQQVSKSCESVLVIQCRLHVENERIVILRPSLFTSFAAGRFGLRSRTLPEVCRDSASYCMKQTLWGGTILLKILS